MREFESKHDNLILAGHKYRTQNILFEIEALRINNFKTTKRKPWKLLNNIVKNVERKTKTETNIINMRLEKRS